MTVKKLYYDCFYNDNGVVNNFKLCEFVVLNYLRKRKLVGEPPATTNDIDKGEELISKDNIYKILRKLEERELVQRLIKNGEKINHITSKGEQVLLGFTLQFYFPNQYEVLTQMFVDPSYTPKQ
jgi:DNA-binding PadR family transcriptional regulator